jgi:hypothetical protein
MDTPRISIPKPGEVLNFNPAASGPPAIHTGHPDPIPGTIYVTNG